MDNAELSALVDRLRRESSEVEWLEFKENRYEPQVLGEYLSALANAACLAGKPRGYLLFGIDDVSPMALLVLRLIPMPSRARAIRICSSG